MAEAETSVETIDGEDVLPVIEGEAEDVAAVEMLVVEEIAECEEEEMIAGSARRPDDSVVKAMVPQASTRTAVQAVTMTPTRRNGCATDGLFWSTVFIRSFCDASGVS